MKTFPTKFSKDRTHRYTLWREWGDIRDKVLFDPHFDYHIGTPEHFVQFIGLNPSTEDEVQNDPTVTRCINFAKSWGFGAMCMTNIFAIRSTDPAKLYAHGMTERMVVGGHHNDETLFRVALHSGLIVCAWGNDGELFNRGNSVKRLLQGDVLCWMLGCEHNQKFAANLAALLKGFEEQGYTLENFSN